MSRMVSFVFLVGIILLVGVIFYRVMASFLVPLFFAALFVVLFRPLHAWMLKQCRGRARVAAGLTTGTIVLIVLLPVVFVVTLAVIEGSSLMAHLDVATLKTQVNQLRTRTGLEMPLATQLREVETDLTRLYQAQAAGDTKTAARDADRLLRHLLAIEQHELRAAGAEGGPERPPAAGGRPNLQPLLEELGKLQRQEPGSLEYEATLQVAMREFREFKFALLGGPYRAWLVELANPGDERLREWSATVFSRAQDWLVALGGATTAFVGELAFGTAIMLLSVYFFLVDGAAMTSSIMRLVPLDQSHQRELLNEFDRISRAVVMATLLSAAVQGLLAGLGFWFAGLGSVFLLTALATVMALVPFVGVAIVWVPACLWLYLVDGRTTAAIVLAVYCLAVVSTVDNLVKPLVLRGESKLHPLLALLSVMGGAQVLGPIGILVGPMVVAFLQTLLGILQREMSKLEVAEA